MGTTRTPLHPAQRGIVAGLLGAIALVVLAIGVTAGHSDAQSGRRLTAGTVPVGTDRSGGDVDLQQVPDLISTADNSGEVVGYIRKADLFPVTAPSPSDASELAGAVVEEPVHEVWDRTGQKLLGHFYPGGVGFRSLAQEKAQRISPAHPPKGTTATTAPG